jgi:endonuclease YncB( thermonuclease family)
MKKLTLGLFIFAAMATPASAQQLAPAPHAAPRTPVSRETVAERRAPPRDVTGAAMVIDGDHLRVDDTDMRLFGVVTPQLSANFGPQARAELDAVVGAGKTLTCRVRDRDHDGHLLASCITPGGDDPAYELLRRGLAVAARGSISGTELEQPYDQAEEAAQAAKMGLWSVMATAPAAAAPVAVVAPKPPEPVVVKAPEAPKVEPIKVELSKTADVVQPRTSSAVVAPVIASAAVSAAKEAVAPAPSDDVGFFARYQLLIAVVLMLSTALSVIAAVLWQRHRERREELKSLAAALRGELQSARAVCLTRVRAIDSDKEDQAAAWPRIRSTLYQACVARLGMLGAELARQVSSIYGQASDYASYYNNLDDDSESTTPKKQALQMLVAHIDEVLPRLAGIERSGSLNATNVYAVPTSAVPPAAAPVATVVETAPVSVVEPVPTLRPRVSSLERRSLTIEEQSFTAPPAVELPASVTPVTTKALPQPSLEDKFRNAIQSLRERFVEHPTQHNSSEADEHMGDYTTMIEEDIERYSFAGDQDDESSPYGRLRH